MNAKVTPEFITRTDIPPLYEHQEASAKFKVENTIVLDESDPGTGKTRSALEAFSRLYEQGEADYMLVLAPLSILEPSWVADAREFVPHIPVRDVLAKHKMSGFKNTDARVFVTNHDSVNWLDAEGLPEGRWVLCLDEFTAFKHRTSNRSKRLAKMRNFFERRWIMSGTPNPNGVTDLWHPVFLLDGGERLGRAFWGFRAQVCNPESTGPGGQYITWVEKEHAPQIVADKLKDITFRVKLEDCIDMPEHSIHHMSVDLPPRLKKQYQQLQREAALEHESGQMITAIHAGAKAQKLSQLCAGAIYDGEGGYKVFDKSRTNLVLELVQQRDHSVVAFVWKHQRDLLIEGAERLGLRYGVIDGSVPVKERNILVERFQSGDLQVIFCHPQSAGHGLTLTRGTATIWASPTLNAEHFQQFNRRIYRAGQKQRTETICIAANDTREVDMYDRLGDKVSKMEDLLHLALNL